MAISLLTSQGKYEEVEKYIIVPDQRFGKLEYVSENKYKKKKQKGKKKRWNHSQKNIKSLRLC